MADHNKPTVTSNYLDFVSEMHGRMDDLAAGLDPARTSATNVPNYSIRWSSVAKKWQYLDGSSWKDLTNEYAINISGSAAKLKNARTISITGGGSSDAVAFDGTKNIEISLNSLDLDRLTGLGSAAGANVVKGTGNSEDDVMSQKAVTDALNSIDIPDFPEVVTSKTDTSGGNKVITQGWMGLGIRITNDNSIASRFAYFSPSTLPIDYPSNWYEYGAMWSIHHGYSGDVAEFIVTHTDNTTFAFRNSRERAWREIYHTGNFPPIGYCYTQYPGTDTPSSLFGGTWTLMFNTEGVFFRTEGQGASSFGGGVQGDAIRNITGTVGAVSRYTAAVGAFVLNNTGDNWPAGSSYPMSRSRFDASRVVPTAAENRPRNRTIRVWRKTAH